MRNLKLIFICMLTINFVNCSNDTTDIYIEPQTEEEKEIVHRVEEILTNNVQEIEEETTNKEVDQENNSNSVAPADAIIHKGDFHYKDDLLEINLNVTNSNYSLDFTYIQYTSFINDVNNNQMKLNTCSRSNCYRVVATHKGYYVYITLNNGKKLAAWVQ